MSVYYTFEVPLSKNQVEEYLSKEEIVYTSEVTESGDGEISVVLDDGWLQFRYHVGREGNLGAASSTRFESPLTLLLGILRSYGNRINWCDNDEAEDMIAKIQPK
mgnify:CR=1 FL=1